MEKLYNRIDFHNDTVPALNDANLNAMSKAIDDLDNRIINLPVVITEESIEKAEAAAARAEEVLESIPSDYSALSAEVQRKADVSALATKADKTQLSNRNLLDNGWFTVNQRGATSYSNGYTVDRWYTRRSDTVVTVTNDGLKFTSTYVGDGNQIMQKYERKFDRDTTVTLSICAKGKYSASLYGFPAYDYESNDFEIKSKTFVIPKGTYTDNYYSVIVGMSTNAGITDSATIRAVKLELGSISTLANDVVPNYAEELLKCQRYFVRLKANTSNHAFVLAHVNDGATLRFPITLPTFMRSNAPTVTYGGVIKATASDSGSAVNCSGLSRVDMCANVLILQTSGTFTVGGNYMMVLNDANTYIDISADL